MDSSTKTLPKASLYFSSALSAETRLGAFSASVRQKMARFLCKAMADSWLVAAIMPISVPRAVRSGSKKSEMGFTTPSILHWQFKRTIPITYIPFLGILVKWIVGIY